MLERTPTTKAQALLDKFGKALEAGDIDSAVNCFQADCYWRDLVTFTWNLKTMEGQDQVRDMLRATLASTKPTGWAVAKGEEASEDGGVITAWITFETSVARGFGLVRFKGDLIWTLLTTMAELKDHEEKAGFTRPLGAKHGHGKGRKTWREERDDEIAELGHTKQPYVVIIGGGQGGIALGARLKQLGVPAIIIEKNERPGDSWRRRYKSLCLHDPVWYDHLPYIDFPKNWPVFAPKDKIGDWLEMYTKVMELNYWSSTTAKSAKYDEKAKEWTIVVERDGKEIVLKPKQLVLATGMSGKANWPKYKGQDIFKGEQQHSSTHPGPDKYRQEGGGYRLQQLGARHLRSTMGRRRRRDHGAALVHPYRQVRHADGYRSRLALFGAGGRERHDDAQGRHDLRFAPIPHPARVPDSALRADEGARREILRRPGKGRLHARLGR